MSFLRATATAVCALALGGTVHAALIVQGPAKEIYSGEDLTPAGTVADTDGNGPDTDNAAVARAAFVSVLQSNVGSYGFENLRAGSSAGVGGLAIDFNDGNNGSGQLITATINGNGVVRGSPDNGRFNTTSTALPDCDAVPNAPPGPCSKYWEVQTGAAGNFSISFSRGVSAFGFYGTDIGDFHGSLSAFLTPDVVGAPEEEVNIITRLGTGGPNGSLLFWGFASRNNAYKSIRFVTDSPSQADFFGFDDFIVADLAPLAGPGAAPEPGSLALAGLALLGLGAARRRGRG